MHYLVDPAAVQRGPFSLIFIACLCVALPLLAVQQHKALASGALRPPTRPQLYGSALITHAALVLGVLVLQWSESLTLFPPYTLDRFGLAVGAAALALGFPLMSERLRAPDAVVRERTRLVAPRTPGEHALFYVVALSAGFSEQVAYRGALFAILTAMLGGWWVPAVLAAFAFGIAHLFQGWRAVGFATLIGVRDQVVVGLTGTLVIAMIVHALHDMIAGTLLGRRMRRDDQGGSSLAVP